MIVTSVLLLVAAIVTLIIGWFQDGLAMVYVSIGASVGALLFLVGGMARRRPAAPATAGAPFGPAERTEAAATAPAEAEERAKPRGPLPQRRPAAKPPTGRPKETEVPVARLTTETPKPPEEVTAKKPAAKRSTTKKPAARKTSAKKRAAKKSSTEKPAAKKTAASRPSPRSLVVAISERGTFHMTDCRFVKGRRDTERITLATAEKRGYSSCGVCKPRG